MHFKTGRPKTQNVVHYQKGKAPLYHLKNVLVLLPFYIILSVNCKNNPHPRIFNVQKARNNQQALENVLEHFRQSPADSVQLQAAVFLLRNMDDKFSYKGSKLDEFHHFCDSISRLPLTQKSYDRLLFSFLKTSPNLVSDAKKVKDLQSLSAEYLIKNIDTAYASWQKSPWKQEVPFDDFCEYILPYRIGNEAVEDFRSPLRQKYLSFLLSHCSMQMAADSILAQTNKKGMFLADFPGYVPDFPLSSLEKLAGGSCRESSNLALYIMRSIGLPVSQDFTPQWPHRGSGHFWTALVLSKDSSADFEGINAPKTGGHILLKDGNRLAKVYRTTFSKQLTSLALLHGDEDIPDFFNNPYFKDVSACYFNGTTVAVHSITKKSTAKRFAYLCVFNNITWTPVCWAPITDTGIVFTGVGTNIVCLPVLYDNGAYQPIDYPVKIDSAGSVTRIVPADQTLETLSLTRKYPLFDWWDSRTLSMKGGKFEASNHRDFSDAVTIYTIQQPPAMNYHTISVHNPGYYTYWRYRAADSSYGEIADIQFYNEKNKLLCGIPIGTTETDSDNRVAVAFDSNPLTYFQGLTSTNNWVGMKFDSPVRLSTIKFIGRNDENFINAQDHYELFYWSKLGWKSLGKKIGSSLQRLEFKNVPSNALYLLHDETKGKEERIFLYEHGKQIWY